MKTLATRTCLTDPLSSLVSVALRPATEEKGKMGKGEKERGVRKGEKRGKKKKKKRREKGRVRGEKGGGKEKGKGCEREG